MRLVRTCGWLPVLVAALSAAAENVPEEAVYQWAADVPGVVSKETGAAPRAYLWLPPATASVKGLVVAQHNMLEEPVFAHPRFRAELARADVGLVWITPMVMQRWDALPEAEIAAIERTLAKLAEVSRHPELAAAPIAPFGHSAMATYPYLLAAARPDRVFCAVSIKGDWPEPGRPCWRAAQTAGALRVPLLLVSGEYEDGFARREKSRALMRSVPEATFSMWVDVGGGHFDWSDELCAGLGRWLAETSAMPRPATGVRRNGFWYPGDGLAKLVADYEALPRGRGKFSVLGYECGGEEVRQNPKAHLQVVFGSGGMEFSVRPVFAGEVPPGRPETWTGLPAGAANPRPDAAEESHIVLQKIQGPVEHLGGDRWAVRYNRYDPRGCRSRSATFQMVYPGGKGFKRCVQQGMVNVPRPKAEIADGGTVAVRPEDFPLPVPPGCGAYVREGSAVVAGGAVRLRDVPLRHPHPLDIVVVAYDLAGKKPSVSTTYRLAGAAGGRFIWYNTPNEDEAPLYRDVRPVRLRQVDADRHAAAGVR